MNLKEELQMLPYWGGKYNGLDVAIAERCPTLAADPVIAQALILIETSRAAIKGRVAELKTEHGED